MLPLVALALLQSPAAPPVIGAKAPAFEVRTVDGKPVRLAPLLRRGPVVLVVLRGWPGYQCPFCTRQVGELIGHAESFAKRRSAVVLVYPGPTDGLKGHADEFIAGKDVPKEFRFAIDPGYDFTDRYGLRWNAPHETAYPSTFVIGRDGKVAYAKVSHDHGDRAPVADILAALDALPR